jgi:hypothetical protein
MLWGVLAGCLAAPGDFAGFTAVRFLLGFAEGGITPALVIITSSWWKKSEQPLRVATWVTCNGLAQIFGALIMYGIGLAHSPLLANWRVMFLVCGGGTLVAGVLFLAFMPAQPGSAWFLNERERIIAVQRMAEERISKEQHSFKISQVTESLMDHRLWLLVLGAFFNTFASPVIKVRIQAQGTFSQHLLTLSLVWHPRHQRLRLVKAQYDASEPSRRCPTNHHDLDRRNRHPRHFNPKMLLGCHRLPPSPGRQHLPSRAPRRLKMGNRRLHLARDNPLAHNGHPAQPHLL